MASSPSEWFADETDDLDAHFQLSDSENDSPQSQQRPIVPPLALPTNDDANAMLWNLISPCSEPPLSPASSDITFGHDDEAPEPETSPTAANDSWKDMEDVPLNDECTVSEAVPIPESEDPDHVRYATNSDDDDDEEVEVFNAEADKLDIVTEADETDDVDVSSTASSHLFDDSTSDDGSVISRPSLVAAVGGKWVGRMKARTYSGPPSITQAYEKIRARTLSATSNLRNGVYRRGEHEDDGDFSSDDEDCNHERRSQLPLPRLSSISFPTRLSTVKSSVKMPTSVPSFMRFRSSSSATTTASEDSFIGGQSASLPTALEAERHHLNSHELKQKASFYASRAAGLVNAASSEAARKLKSSRAFRSSSQPTMSSMVNSPVVDNIECSPPIRVTDVVETSSS